MNNIYVQQLQLTYIFQCIITCLGWQRVCVCVREWTNARVFVCVCLCVCVCVYVLVHVSVFVSLSLSLCVHACVLAFVRMRKGESLCGSGSSLFLRLRISAQNSNRQITQTESIGFNTETMDFSQVQTDRWLRQSITWSSAKSKPTDDSHSL